MTEALQLFDARTGKHHVGAKAQPTEIDAAWQVRFRSGTSRRAVFEALGAAGGRGLTDDEIRRATGLPRQSICARRSELKDNLLIVKSGKRRVGDAGLGQQVWMLSERGREIHGILRVTP